MQFKARTWKFGDNINTDLILPGFAMLMPMQEQAKYAFSANRPGWVDLVEQGDVVIGGSNFGTGSGRPGARSLKMCGVSCLVADSINGLFFRNCVNYGLFAMECPGISGALSEGDVMEVDFGAFKVTNVTTGVQLPGLRFPQMLRDIMNAGGIYPLMEARGLLAEPNPETA